MIGALMGAACGSTVPLEQQEAIEAGGLAASDGGLSGGLPEGAHVNDKGQVVSASGEVLGDAKDFGLSTGGSTSGGSNVATTGGETSGGTGGTTSGPTGGDGGDGGDGSTAGPVGDNGPGITADTIKIGVSYADDAEEGNAALGAAGATQINTRRAWEALLKYVNDRGGVDGRKLVPVFHRLSATSTEPFEQQDQEVCAHWSEDDPVFVSDGAFKTDNGISCFQEHGMVTVTTNGLRYKSNAFFERFPTYLEFDGVDEDSIGVMYADHMKKMGYFNKGAKLGIVAWDDPEYAGPTQNSLIPRLKQNGVTPTDVVYTQYPTNGADIGNAVAQVGNTAVKFKGEGITHVMFMDSGAQLALFFMQAAQRQQYAPRYGLTSASGNTALADLLAAGGAGDARQQLEDALSIGWLPSIDVRQDDAPSWANPPVKKVCYEQMRKGGVEMDSANARALADSVCDSVWTIQATLEAAGDVINQETWYRALAQASDTQLTGGMGFSISPTRRDGVETAIEAKFVDSCVCFRYVGNRFAIPN
jgi:hypothetical protein